MKTPYRDGTTHVIFEPLDFIATPEARFHYRHRDLQRGGTIKVIACIEDPAVIKKILTHLKGQAAPEPAGLLSSVQALPLVSLPRTGRPVGLFD